MDAHPAGKSLDVFVSVIPFSEKIIALDLPESCSLDHKSDGHFFFILILTEVTKYGT